MFLEWSVIVYKFSTKRLLLILSWIGFAVAIMFVNTRINPNYNNNTFSVAFAVICLSYVAFIITGFLGINKKVQDFEHNQWKLEFREENKEEIAEIVRDIQIQQTESKQQGIITNAEPSKLEIFNEKMEYAKRTWKSKKKKEYTGFDKYHQLNYLITIFRRLKGVALLILSFSAALILLNSALVKINLYIVVIGLFILQTVFFLCGVFLVSRQKKLREELYPESLKGMLKEFNIW